MEKLSAIKCEVTLAAAHMVHTVDTKCFNLHGHNWKVVVELSGTIQEDGMVVDFNDVKALLNQFDHKVWFPKISDCSKMEDYRELCFSFDDAIEMPVDVITCENVAQYFADILITRFPQLHLVEVTLYEGERSSAVTYAYTEPPFKEEEE
jgi:6-pyruvoyltetrahydropterin/6-carboxytetrahydropterin synthase